MLTLRSKGLNVVKTSRNKVLGGSVGNTLLPFGERKFMPEYCTILFGGNLSPRSPATDHDLRQGLLLPSGLGSCAGQRSQSQEHHHRLLRAVCWELYCSFSTRFITLPPFAGGRRGHNNQKIPHTRRGKRTWYYQCWGCDRSFDGKGITHLCFGGQSALFLLQPQHPDQSNLSVVGKREGEIQDAPEGKKNSGLNLGRMESERRTHP